MTGFDGEPGNASKEFIEYVDHLITEKKQEGQWLQRAYERRYIGVKMSSTVGS